MDRLVKYMVSAASEGAVTIETAGTETEELAPVLVTKDVAEVDGDYQKLDLSGSWYFEYRGANQIVDIEGFGASDYHKWSVVEAGAANWTKGYGNISEENVDASYGEDYFDYFITGNGY